MTPKLYPCPVCRATGRQPHLQGCGKYLRTGATMVATKSKPKKKSSKKKPTYKPTRAKVVPKLINRIALVVDNSSSMQSIKMGAIDAVNAQINSIKSNAYATKQETYVSVYDFDDNVRPVTVNQFPESVQLRTVYNYIPNGNTALIDAVCLASLDLETASRGEKNTSCLIIVITDGQENKSKRFNSAQLKEMITRLQGTDRWSFAFSVPRGYTYYATQFGVPSGNIQEWEQTDVGAYDMGTSNALGTQTFYRARTLGATKVDNFYTDLSSVTKTDLKKLDDVSGDYHKWTVSKEEGITEFVNSKLSTNATLQKKVGYIYQPGRAYYELTKPEKIQGHKDMVILNKKTDKMYGGPQARRIIGIDPTKTMKVTPGNHGDYTIFVKSTSMNRKLVRGTSLLYRLV